MHLSKLPSGLWRVSVKHQGRRATATAPTKGAATQRGAELLLKLGGVPKESPTVDILLEGHLASARLSPTTLADYRTVKDLHIPDSFLQRTVSDVTPRIIDALYQDLYQQGVSAHRIGRIHDLISSAWNRQALRYEWATHNPAHGASSIALPLAAEIVPPTPHQVAKLIKAAPPGFGEYLRVAASTGARRGELVALQWDDIRNVNSVPIISAPNTHFPGRATISIRRSLAYTPSSGVVERPTKTGQKGHRTISVGKRVLDTLKQLRDAQAEKAAGDVDPRYVFSATAGATPWHPNYPTTAFARTLDRAGLDGIRLHDLRHFVATRMLANGHSVAQVSARLGQTQAATTHRYAHWISQTDAEAAEDLEALLDD